MDIDKSKEKSDEKSNGEGNGEKAPCCGTCEYWGGIAENNVCLYGMSMEKFYDCEKQGGYVVSENDHCKNYREKSEEKP
jgi:hypothetical protein